MRPPARSVTVGTYLAWKRGPIAARLLVSLAGVALVAPCARLGLAPLDTAGQTAGLLALAVAAWVAAWLLWRNARTAVRAVVDRSGLTLEPLAGGPAYRWRWSEVHLRRTWTEDDGALVVRAASTGTVFVKHDGSLELEHLVRAIRAQGGTVQD